jgi:glutathione S-transferase
MRWAEREVPSPPLWPADPSARGAVEVAEAWGDRTLQPLARRVIWWGLRSRPDAMPSFLAGSSLPVPAWAARLSGPVTAMVEWRLNAVSEDAVCADVAAMPSHLDRIGAWMDEGVLGGSDTPNAADLQIASSLALIRALHDLRPAIDAHRAGELPRRFFGDYPGDVPSGALP